MNSVEETGLSQIVDLPLIGSAEQDLFSVEDDRERADKLQELLVPKLKVLIEQACGLIHQVYGTDVLSHCRITTTPAHRPGAKKTKAVKVATAGLAIKGKSWYFQQRFECTSDSLSVHFFGLRGLEGNPIVQVLKNHWEDVTRILEQGRYEVYSYAIGLPGEAFDELINKLQLVPEGDWTGTYIWSPSLVLPIKDLDAAQPVIDNFVTLFAIFRAAINVFLGEEDRFEDYVKCLWDWQSPLQVQESVTTTRFFPDEVDSVQTFREGAVRQVSVNAYEREPKARQKCIDYYGSSCSICGFDFGRAFGQLGKGFIHVHHLRPISEIAEEYEIDPIKDLRPVCPNCHAMIHRRSPPFSLEEIKMLLKSARASTI
ncbi:HNH endonuclease [Microcoleus vaginatus]|uniref:HNH endonuclease n=1 Tax=Microcoleus vaginatus TaxID=119532 RepID=UPI00168501D5|nr:HNH endonuclease [Microcoleus sp. FACHB-84]MBD2011457.1 HNH endonuclease [Microcoleus sp. FACHB-45]